MKIRFPGFKILDRYILGKFLATYFFAIAMIIVIVVIFDYAEKIDDFTATHAPMKAILLQNYLNFIPFFINQFSGLFTFIACIFFTSKMAYQTEIVAMLSGGMSFRRLMWPYFLGALIIASLSLTLNLWVIPRSQRRVIAFQQEYMNNPLSEGEVIKEVVWGKCPPLDRIQFAVAYADPAPSNARNKASSFKANFLLGYCDGKFYVFTGFLDHVTNDVFVEWFYNLRDYAGERVQVYYFIENNTLQDPFYEQVFLPMFAARARERGFIGITPDVRCKPPKFERIEGNLEPLIRQGRLVLNIDERENPHMKRLEEQFLLLNRQMKSPADGPDCIEGGVWIINQKISTLNVGSYTIGRRHHASKRF